MRTRAHAQREHPPTQTRFSLHVLSGGIEVLLQARKMTVGVEIQEKVPAQKKRKKIPFFGGEGVTDAPQKKNYTCPNPVSCDG